MRDTIKLTLATVAAVLIGSLIAVLVTPRPAPIQQVVRITKPATVIREPVWPDTPETPEERRQREKLIYGEANAKVLEQWRQQDLEMWCDTVKLPMARSICP